MTKPFGIRGPPSSAWWRKVVSRLSAERYFQAYADAIGAIADNATGADVIEKPGISVKLSALHPRYELAQRHQVRVELLPRLKQLAVLAADILRVVEIESANDPKQTFVGFYVSAGMNLLNCLP